MPASRGEQHMSLDVKHCTLLDLLTERQFQTAALISEGLNNKEIGRRLGTSEHVVKNYLRAIYDKAGCWSRLELALRYVHEDVHGFYLLGREKELAAISIEAVDNVNFVPAIYQQSSV